MTLCRAVKLIGSLLVQIISHYSTVLIKVPMNFFQEVTKYFILSTIELIRKAKCTGKNCFELNNSRLSNVISPIVKNGMQLVA